MTGTDSPSLASLKQGTIDCDCGCARAYPLYSGMLAYGAGRSLAFRLAHFDDTHQNRRLWLLLGSGPWFENDAGGCWCVLDNWIDDGTLISRVRDARDSPFVLAHIFDERFLTRDEVLAQAGALEWAIKRREDLLRLHAPSRAFIVGDTFDA